jgi:hypothetical protein
MLQSTWDFDGRITLCNITRIIPELAVSICICALELGRSFNKSSSFVRIFVRFSAQLRSSRVRIAGLRLEPLELYLADRARVA